MENGPAQNEHEESIADVETIAANYRGVLARVAAACGRAGRDAASVTVIGVTKLKPAALVRNAAAAGIADFGENYVQEMVAKQAEAAVAGRWHFIGHLQRNKVRLIVPIAAMIHSVDSVRLAAEIDRTAERLGIRIPVLLQVNTSGEASKRGTAPDDAVPLAREAVRMPHLDVRGMMTVAAPLDDPEEVRPMFRMLRALRDRAADATGHPMGELSMGMTGDFEAAVEEGATLIRIGTALFGSRR